MALGGAGVPVIQGGPRGEHVDVNAAVPFRGCDKRDGAVPVLVLYQATKRGGSPSPMGDRTWKAVMAAASTPAAISTAPSSPSPPVTARNPQIAFPRLPL